MSLEDGCLLKMDVAKQHQDGLLLLKVVPTSTIIGHDRCQPQLSMLILNTFLNDPRLFEPVLGRKWDE